MPKDSVSYGLRRRAEDCCHSGSLGIVVRRFLVRDRLWRRSCRGRKQVVFENVQRDHHEQEYPRRKQTYHDHDDSRRSSDHECSVKPVGLSSVGRMEESRTLPLDRIDRSSDFCIRRAWAQLFVGRFYPRAALLPKVGGVPTGLGLTIASAPKLVDRGRSAEPHRVAMTCARSCRRVAGSASSRVASPGESANS